MKHVVVAGLTNVETAVAVERFPVDYAKSRFVFHGVRDRVGGVGFNVSAALAWLGVPARLATLLGPDLLGDLVEAELARVDRLDASGALRLLSATPRSAMFVDPAGRAAMFTDLKESQESRYPEDAARRLLDGAALLHATNIEWALPLARVAKSLGVPVSTDVHAVRSFAGDDYNRRFLEVADVVFFSAENLDRAPDDAIRELWREWDVSLAVCGMGERGAMAGDRATGEIVHLPATPLRPVLNATGAGDALAAGFLASWLASRPLADCLLRGQLFAGWKVGEAGAGRGFCPLETLETEFERRR